MGFQCGKLNVKGIIFYWQELANVSKIPTLLIQTLQDATFSAFHWSNVAVTAKGLGVFFMYGIILMIL